MESLHGWMVQNGLDSSWVTIGGAVIMAIIIAAIYLYVQSDDFLD